jgi:hypothetical protein
VWFLRRRKDDKSGDEAKEALENAQQQLIEVQERGEEVTNLAQAFKELRERNHFSEKFEELLKFPRRSLQ